MKKLYFATSNDDKFSEYQKLLDGIHLELLNLPDFPEDRSKHIFRMANAKLEQVRSRADEFSYPFFVEETHLVINSWNGLPGAYSSVFIRALHCPLICRMMKDFKGSERSATIKKAIVFLKSPDAVPKPFTGNVEGFIAEVPRSGGFGWDDIFVPQFPEHIPNNTKTFSELGIQEKQRLMGLNDPVVQFRNFLSNELRIDPLKNADQPEINTTENPRRILLVLSQAKDDDLIQIYKESSRIEETLERAVNRDRFEIIKLNAATVSDLRHALITYGPEIVHFSGHGVSKNSDSDSSTQAGLAFENDFGERQIVSGPALASLFGNFEKSVKCVILNACHSDSQAKVISNHIDYVIGMRNEIDDDSAIEFSRAFYDALFGGHSIESSYRISQSDIECKGKSGSIKTKLLKRSD